jgi:hypothetical protein
MNSSVARPRSKSLRGTGHLRLVLHLASPMALANNLTDLGKS